MTSASRLRRLPVSVPPFPAEALDSYLARVAAGNHLPVDRLREHLRDPNHRPGTGPVLPARLAAAVGHPVEALRRTLPELHDRTKSGWDYPGHLLDRFHDVPRPACGACAAARGITRPVNHWAPAHRTVCLRHQRWTGPTVRHLTDQCHLAGVPEVLTAARRHRNLVRRHGHLRLTAAYRDAEGITLQWAQRREFGRHRDRRLDVLAPGQHIVFLRDPVIHAAIYPDTVALASLLASPHWLTAAASPDGGERQRFLAEAARRLDLPEYTPYGFHEPLHHWARLDARYALAELTEPRQLEEAPERINPNE